MVRSVITLQILCSIYLRANTELEPSTRQLTRYAFIALIKCCGELDIEDFEYCHAEQFRNWASGPPRSKVTANIYVKTIRPAFRWAIRQHLIKADPFSVLRLYRVARKRVNIFDGPDFERMLESVPEPKKIWRCRLLLAKTAGLRKSEVLNLTVDDIGNGVIHISPKPESIDTWRWVPKDKDVRDVPLVDEAAELLEELGRGKVYPLLTISRYYRLMELKRRGHLLDRLRTRPDENWGRPWSKICRRAQVKGTFHDLRRTAITEWLENGLTPHEVMRLAGHADLQTTLAYIGYRDGLVAKAKRASSKVLRMVVGPQNRSSTTPMVRSLGATGLEPATS